MTASNATSASLTFARQLTIMVTKVPFRASKVAVLKIKPRETMGYSDPFHFFAANLFELRFRQIYRKVFKAMHCKLQCWKCGMAFGLWVLDLQKVR